MSGKSKKKKRKWSKTSKRYATVAVIAALIGIVLDFFAVKYFTNDVDYSGALQITSVEAASELQDYSGKVAIQGNLSGTTYNVRDAYDKTEKEKTVDVDGDFIYTELILTRPEKYIKNQEEVDKEEEAPVYDVHDVRYIYHKQADDLNIYGIAIDLTAFGCYDAKDYGELYDTSTEKAELQGIEGPEAPVALIGEMENGNLVSASVYVNGTIEEAIENAAGSLIVFHVLLAIWLAICGFVIFSMYLQRYR